MNNALRRQYQSGDVAWYFRGRYQGLLTVVLGFLSVVATGVSARSAPLQARPGASSVVAPADVDEQAFVRFNEWLEAYLAAGTPEAKNALEAKGIELARARREPM